MRREAYTADPQEIMYVSAHIAHRIPVKPNRKDNSNVKVTKLSSVSDLEGFWHIGSGQELVVLVLWNLFIPDVIKTKKVRGLVTLTAKRYR